MAIESSRSVSSMTQAVLTRPRHWGLRLVYAWKNSRSKRHGRPQRALARTERRAFVLVFLFLFFSPSGAGPGIAAGTSFSDWTAPGVRTSWCFNVSPETEKWTCCAFRFRSAGARQNVCDGQALRTGVLELRPRRAHRTRDHQE